MKKTLLIILALLMGLAFVPALATVSAERVKNQVVTESEDDAYEDDVMDGEDSADDIQKNRVRSSEDDSSDEGESKEKEAGSLERVRERAEYAIKNAVRRYERVKAQVQKSNLTEEAKQEVLAKIETQIASMNALKNQVMAAETVDEVKGVVAQTKTRFKYSLGVVRQAVRGVYEDRLENVSEKIDAVYAKIAAKVEALEEGEDKNDLSALLTEAEALIASGDAALEAGELEAAVEDYKDARETMHVIVTTLTEGV